ncbi:uncharacterized protein LTR77_004566 [Saxophila tyrrhenica]|uniref:Methyltransferase domain-containing protein n=1 Tax=Saxophila tyrrhenica TaxID=1690608 RepID=A0AAV9PD46_9PEZI|nr:hypothetical protein LTR77_004566 [Saxophila tyrrhenica]
MEDPKEIVRQTYDNIAEWYLRWITDQRSPRERYTTKVLENAPPSPRILEMGCGPGVPITRMLLDHGADVVANDISSAQINMAQARCPTANFVLEDMAGLSFEPASFDGVVSFFTVFHLPREEQKEMLAKIYRWLRPGGMVAFNLATVDEEEIHGEFLGHGMFWSSFPAEENKKMVTDVGFELVEATELDAGDGKLEEDDPDYGVTFLWMVGRKPIGE